MNSIISKFEDKLQKVLFPLAEKLSSLAHLSALKNGMTILINNL